MDSIHIHPGYPDFSTMWIYPGYGCGQHSYGEMTMKMRNIKIYAGDYCEFLEFIYFYLEINECLI